MDLPLELPKLNMMQYQEAAARFDNHDPAHLFDAYMAGFTSETLEFIHEAKQFEKAHSLTDFNTTKFALESGDMLWNITMLMEWWGYDFNSAEYGQTAAYRSALTMETRDLIDLLLANIMAMNGRHERSYRAGNTSDNTAVMKIMLQHVYSAWVVLNFRAGYTPEDIANLNIKKLCNVYSIDHWQIIIDVTK